MLQSGFEAGDAFVEQSGYLLAIEDAAPNPVETEEHDRQVDGQRPFGSVDPGPPRILLQLEPALRRELVGGSGWPAVGADARDFDETGLGEPVQRRVDRPVVDVEPAVDLPALEDGSDPVAVVRPHREQPEHGQLAAVAPY